MIPSNSIDKKITSLLPSLTNTQKKAVLGVVKSYVGEDNYVDEKEFYKEMDRRVEEFESGKVKGLTFNEIIDSARKKYRKILNK